MFNTGFDHLDDGFHPDDDPRVLRDPAADPYSAVHSDCQTPDGESSYKSWPGEQSAQVSQTGGHDVGHGGAVLLPMLVALQSPNPLDYHCAAEDGRLARHRGLLQPPVLLQSNAVPELGDQSDPLQFNVDQIQGGFPQVVRLGTRQEKKEENVRAYGHIHDRLDQLQQQPLGLLAKTQQQQELQRAEGIMQRRVRGQTNQIAFTCDRKYR